MAAAFLTELLRGKPAGHPACIWSKGAGARWPLLAEDAARLVPTLGADPYVAVSFVAPGAGAELGRNKRTSNATAAGIYGLWLDLDVKPGGAPSLGDAEALARAFAEPTLLVATGGGLHVWHLFEQPWTFADENDRRAADLAARWQEAHRRAVGWDIDPTADLARVLRIPGSISSKHDKRVVLLDAVGPRHSVDDLAAAVAHVVTPPPPPALEPAARGRPSGPVAALKAITADEYVPKLTGREVGRDRKIACPFHDDWNPSFHVYPDDGGWFCFQCKLAPGRTHPGRGGDIFTLAAALWGLDCEDDFPLVVDRLLETFRLVEPRALQLDYAWRRP